MCCTIRPGSRAVAARTPPHQRGRTFRVRVSWPGVGRDPRPAGRVQRYAGRQRPVQALRRAGVVRRVQPERQLPVQLHQGDDDLRIDTSTGASGVRSSWSC